MNNLLNISVLFSLLVACLMAILGHFFSARTAETTSTPAKECETKTETIRCNHTSSDKKQPKSKAKKEACVTFKQSTENNS